VIRYAWKLLHARMQITWNTLRRARNREKVGYSVAALGILMLIVFTGLGGFGLGAGLTRGSALPAAQREALLDGLHAALIAAVFLMAFFTGFGTALQGMYLSNDLELLLSFPVPVRAVFVAKQIESAVGTFGLAAALSVPPLVGFSLSARQGPAYVVAGLLAILLSTTAGATLSTLVVMIAARVVPARRLAEILGVIAALASLLCSQIGWLAGTLRRSQTAANGLQALQALAMLDAPWSPFHWAGYALRLMGRGEWPAGAPYLALFAAAALACGALCLFSAERLYYSGWARVQVAPRRVRSSRSAAGAAPGAAWLERVAVWRRLRAMRAIVVKDWRLLRRDLRYLSGLITPFVLLLLYSASLLVNPLPSSATLTTMLKLARPLPGLGLGLFTSMLVANQLALMAFSLEGRQYWQLKSAPLRARELLAAKFLYAYLPLVVLGTLMVLLLDVLLGAAWLDVLHGLAAVLLIGAGLVALNLAVGVSGVRFDWDNPMHMVRGWTGCVTQLLDGTFLVVSSGVFFAPLFVARVLGANVLVETAALLAGTLVGGALALGVTIVAWGYALQRVPGLNED
jgi:ABC-2 type transport system permease protein